jgi:uncharacterized protein (DUF736 family)
MAFKPKDNTGCLFPNKKKATDKHPDFTGYVIVNGERVQLAGWKKSGDKGTFLSLTVSEGRNERTENNARRETDPFE